MAERSLTFPRQPSRPCCQASGSTSRTSGRAPSRTRAGSTCSLARSGPASFSSCAGFPPLSPVWAADHPPRTPRPDPKLLPRGRALAGLPRPPRDARSAHHSRPSFPCDPPLNPVTALARPGLHPDARHAPALPRHPRLRRLLPRPVPAPAHGRRAPVGVRRRGQPPGRGDRARRGLGRGRQRGRDQAALVEAQGVGGGGQGTEKSERGRSREERGRWGRAQRARRDVVLVARSGPLISRLARTIPVLYMRTRSTLVRRCATCERGSARCT